MRTLAFLAALLLSFGADTRVTNADGLTPHEAALRRGLEEAAALIADSGSADRE